MIENEDKDSKFCKKCLLRNSPILSGGKVLDGHCSETK